MSATAIVTVVCTVALIGLLAWRKLSPSTCPQPASPAGQRAIAYGFVFGTILGVLLADMIFLAGGVVCGSIVAMSIDAKRNPTMLP